MDLRIRTEGTVAIVTPPGPYLDASNHEGFMRSLDPVFGQTGQVILDFSGLEAIDSSGLGAVAWSMRRTRQAGGGLGVCGAHGAVRRAFDLVHMDRIVRLFDDCHDALTWFRQGQSPEG